MTCLVIPLIGLGERSMHVQWAWGVFWAHGEAWEGWRETNERLLKNDQTTARRLHGQTVRSNRTDYSLFTSVSVHTFRFMFHLLCSLNSLTVPLGPVRGHRSGRSRALRAFHCSLRNLTQGTGATMHACRDPVPRNSTSPRQGGWSGSPDRVTL